MQTQNNRDTGQGTLADLVYVVRPSLLVLFPPQRMKPAGADCCLGPGTAHKLGLVHTLNVLQGNLWPCTLADCLNAHVLFPQPFSGVFAIHTHKQVSRQPTG